LKLPNQTPTLKTKVSKKEVKFRDAVGRTRRTSRCELGGTLKMEVRGGWGVGGKVRTGLTHFSSKYVVFFVYWCSLEKKMN
jgi:hypothetical protein